MKQRIARLGWQHRSAPSPVVRRKGAALDANGDFISSPPISDAEETHLEEISDIARLEDLLREQGMYIGSRGVDHSIIPPPIHRPDRERGPAHVTSEGE